MQTRDDVLAVLDREGGHAVDRQIDASVRAEQLPDPQQVGIEIKRVKLRAQIVT